MKTARQAWEDYRSTNNLAQDSKSKEFFEAGYSYLVTELIEQKKAEMNEMHSKVAELSIC